RAVSLYSTAGAGAYLTGQVVTGGLIRIDPTGLGFRWAFGIVVPMVAAVLLLSRHRLVEPPMEERTRIDRTGVALIGLVSVLILYPLTQGRTAGWPAWAFVALVAAVPAGALLIGHERRFERRGGLPIMRLELFSIRSFAAGNALAILVGLMGFSIT